MKKAIILHGRPRRESYYNPKRPAESNKHWLPWLQKELLRNDIHAQTPEVFQSYKPTYEKWAKEINRFNPDEDTIIVGHSCGGGMIVQWLSKNPNVRVNKVILVAPWIDLERDDWPAFDFTIDENLVGRTGGLTIIHSTDDVDEIHSSVYELKNKLKGNKYMEFKGKGHFTQHYMPENIFPELLEEILDEK